MIYLFNKILTALSVFKISLSCLVKLISKWFSVIPDLNVISTSAVKVISN